MRMRFKPYAHDELMAADFHVHEPLIWGGKWHAQYARPEQPFVLELGCGKGGFISQLACAHPENNYLGIDITDKVLILAKRKIEAAYQAAGRPIDNVKICLLYTSWRSSSALNCTSSVIGTICSKVFLPISVS